MAPLLLILARESAIILPLLLITTSIVTRNFKDKDSLIVLLGWLTGLLIYQVYISLSNGVSYSDFQPHIPTPSEIYRSIMNVLTPILPWEVSHEDLQTYVNLHITTTLTLSSVIIVIIHVLAIIIAIPIALSLTRINDFHRVIIGWSIFGFLAAIGLLFLKGDIDFFRHLSYLLPIVSLLIEKGLAEIEKNYKIGALFIKMSYVLLFALYFIRTIRLYNSGYAFDACEYVLKRTELSSVEIFYETACS